MKLKEMEKIDRPREKLIKYGPDRLTNEELMAIILRNGIKQKNVLELSKDLLRNFKFDDLNYNNFDKIKSFYGIGEVKACEILACFELGRRYLQGKKNTIYLKPEDVYRELAEFRTLKKEHFIVLYLDTKNQEIKKQVVSIGTINFSIVHPREVFEEAIKNLATSIIIAHNHPSNYVEPSQDDIKLTKRLIEAGKILGIELIDHVIISKDKYFSFKEHNLI